MADDVSRWLAGLGLEKYADVFASNDVGWDVLPSLGDLDLKELGISLGDRKRLLLAIARVPARSVGSPWGIPSGHQAERRQLTVLFGDLVGSTALAQGMDPEDLRSVILAFQDAAAGAIGRYEGHVAKFMGDGVLAYFGYPRAHEDDAERAVRAGLALIDRVHRLERGDGLTMEVRVGIATGVVVVGDLVGEGGAREEAAVGDTLNLAARLQEAAAPGTLVVAAATRLLLGQVFEIENMGARPLKGMAEPVDVWRIAGERAVGSRFEAVRSQQLNRMVGRDQELGLALSRWGAAMAGEGQVLLLRSEPGIGKSRLVAELRERLEPEVVASLRYQCSPHHANSVLYPVIQQLIRSAQFESEDTVERRLEKLASLVRRSAIEPARALPLLAPMLLLPLDNAYPPAQGTAQQQKAQTLALLVDLLVGLAVRGPVMVIVEDLHWVDPTTRELLDLVVGRIEQLRVVLLATFRPEIAVPWEGRGHVSLITLNRLARRQVEALIGEVTQGKTLPPEVLQQIVDKTDGVPLFVEELTKAMLESGLLREAGDRFELLGPLRQLAVPSSLQASLLSRFDRLAPAREVAQIGAALGREFEFRLLAAVAPHSEAELTEALLELQHAELIFPRGTAPNMTWTFKHALVQEAAYDTLLKASRGQLHAKIALAIETEFPLLAEAEGENLARHHIEAGNVERGLDCLLAAGRKALEKSAFAEAKSVLRSAIGLVARTPDAVAMQRRELEAQILLGNVLMATEGYGASDVGSVYQRAQQLATRLRDRQRELPALYGLWAFRYSRAELQSCLQLADRLLEVALELADRVAEMTARRLSAFSLFPLGRIKAALVDCELAIGLYRPADDGHLAVEYAQDPYVASIMAKAWCLTPLGALDRALEAATDSVAYARRLDHPHTLAYALGWTLSHTYMWRRDAAGAVASAEECVAISREHGFRVPLAAGLRVLAWALAERGDHQRALAAIDEAWSVFETTGGMLQRPMACAIIAKTELRLGRLDAAESFLDDGLSAGGAGAFVWCMPEVYRLKARVACRRATAAPGEAESWLRKAIDLARAFEAPLWHLRAVKDLLELQVGGENSRSARDALRPIYAGFTEGLDTPDLVEAKLLLEQQSLPN